MFPLVHGLCLDGCCICVQPITRETADAIAQECPGLFEVEGKGKSRKAKVNSAREHPKLLEKVQHSLPACIISWLGIPDCYMSSANQVHKAIVALRHRTDTHMVVSCSKNSYYANDIVKSLTENSCFQVRRLSGVEPWKDLVRLQKRKDHFLWTIESTGEQPAMNICYCLFWVQTIACRQLHADNSTIIRSRGMMAIEIPAVAAAVTLAAAAAAADRGAYIAGQPPEALFVAAIDILVAKCDKLLESL